MLLHRVWEEKGKPSEWSRTSCVCNQTIRQEEDLAATTTSCRDIATIRDLTMYARVCKDNKINAQCMIYHKRKHCLVSYTIIWINPYIMILQINISEFRVQKFRSSLRPKERALVFVKFIVRLEDEKSYSRTGRTKNENNGKKKELCSISVGEHAFLKRVFSRTEAPPRRKSNGSPNSPRCTLVVSGCVLS